MGSNYIFSVTDHSWPLRQQNPILPNLLPSNCSNALFKKADCSEQYIVKSDLKHTVRHRRSLQWKIKALHNPKSCIKFFFCNMYSLQSAPGLLNHHSANFPFPRTQTAYTSTIIISLSTELYLLSVYIPVLIAASTENLGQALVWQAMKNAEWEITFW